MAQDYSLSIDARERHLADLFGHGAVTVMTLDLGDVLPMAARGSWNGRLPRTVDRIKFAPSCLSAVLADLAESKTIWKETGNLWSGRGGNELCVDI